MEFELKNTDIEDINKCFNAYVFYHHDKEGNMECWCTHCNKHFFISLYQKTQTDDEWNLYNLASHNQEIICPHCKAKATAKQTGKAKGCKNLWEERRVVIIRRISSEYVIAQSMHCYKDYAPGCYLPTPQIYPFRQYEFTPKGAVCYEREYYGKSFIQLRVYAEPFRTKGSNWYYTADNSYEVIGINELKNSFLKYNQLDSFCDWHYQRQKYGIIQPPIMKYLCWLTIQPQIEILQKLGYMRIVDDLVSCGLKNFPFVNWKAQKINDFFKMTKQEYKEFDKAFPITRKSDAISYLKVRHWLKKNNYKHDIKTVNKYFNGADGYDGLKEAERVFLKFKEPVLTGIDYLITQYRKFGNGGFRWFAGYFEDYRDMAEKYKLGDDEEVKYPPNITAAHDRAVAIQNAIIAEEKARQEKKLLKKYKVIHEKNKIKYAFNMDGFIISVPASSSEIIQEGKNMCHCVGGYAERHLTGKLTILFLRKESEPNNSLYTIEMHGKVLNQVQGYKNKTPLTDEAKVFFDKWLDWVKSGSQRREDGTPILKTKMKNIA